MTRNQEHPSGVHRSPLSVTPTAVRSLIVDSYVRMYSVRNNQLAQLLDLSVDVADLREHVNAMVRDAFEVEGGDFDEPDRSSLIAATRYLVATADTWGVPLELVDHERGYIILALDALSEF